MKAIHKKIIRNFFDDSAIDAVLVFGSQATGRSTPNSDVDIAVLYSASRVPSPEKVIELKETLSAQLKQRVDLIVLNRANPILTHQVFKSNMILINKNPSHLNTVFVWHVTAYADLKRSRKIIEESLIKRRLYG